MNQLKTRLKRLCLRARPPGIILHYSCENLRWGERKEKTDTGYLRFLERKDGTASQERSAFTCGEAVGFWILTGIPIPADDCK
ncbi:hypothetical protein MHYP_G00349750 [Metynnis hypsauchen]